MLAGLWFFREMMLDALSDLWPRLQARVPRGWFARAEAMPAVLVADHIHRPAQAGRLWYGATLSGSDPPAADPQAAAVGLAAIARHDPSFREQAVIDLARRAAPSVLRAWTDQDPRLSHRIMAAVIWEQQKEDVAAYRSDGRRNVLEDLRVREAAVVGAATDARFDTVVVRLRLGGADYDVAVATQAIVRGSPMAIAWTEHWTFQRPLPIVLHHKAAATCSQCGAPVDLDVAGVCASCDAELNGPPPGWVLSRIDIVPEQAQPQAA